MTSTLPNDRRSRADSPCPSPTRLLLFVDSPHSKFSSKTGGILLNRSKLPGSSRRLIAGAISLFLLSALPSAIGCKSTPSNPMIGTWQLAIDGTGPKVCGVSTKMTFTSDTSETWNDKGVSGGPAMISYVVELPNVFIPGGRRLDLLHYGRRSAHLAQPLRPLHLLPRVTPVPHISPLRCGVHSRHPDTFNK